MLEGENERQVAQMGFGRERLVEGVLLRMCNVYNKEG